MNMKKIYIIGCVGSGKSTFAKRLSRQLDIPYYELDEIAYRRTNGKREKVTVQEQESILADIDNAGAWILEGVYRKSYHSILDKCDTIIFLDPPLGERRINIIKRFIKQQIGIATCNYKSDLKMLSLMLKWNKDFETTKVLFEKRLKPYQEKIIYIINPKKMKKIDIDKLSNIKGFKGVMIKKVKKPKKSL